MSRIGPAPGRAVVVDRVAKRAGRKTDASGRTRRPKARRRGDRQAAGPRVKVWVQFGPRTKVGEGRVRLLELVDELGSLRRAVHRLGMSYRSAWGYCRELEAVAGVAFLERPTTRDLRAGVRLTTEGRRFLRRFRRFERATSVAAEREFRRAFGRQPLRRR